MAPVNYDDANLEIFACKPEKKRSYSPLNKGR